MTVEDRIRTAFERLEPESHDGLLERIEVAVAEDQRHRRRVRLGMTAGAVATVGAVAVGTWIGRGGTTMAWWVLELITTILLVGLALLLGPFLRRFGKAYAGDVFRANPRTGKSFVMLMDLAFYLLFLGYILMTARFEQSTAWGIFGNVTGAQLAHESTRVGGILLIVAVLHGINIMVLPVIGRLFTMNLRLDRDTLDR